MSEKNKREPKGYWTANRCIQEVETFVKNEGRRPMTTELGKAGLPSETAFQNAVGCTYAQYCKKQGYTGKYLPIWTRESIIAATDLFFEQHGRYPKPDEYNLAHGLPSHNTFLAHFGITAGNYWKQRYPLQEKWTPETIKKAFEHFIECHSRLPTIKELKPEHGLPSAAIVLNRTSMATYTEFCQKYFPSFSLHRSVWNYENCIQAVDQFVVRNGRRPKYGDCHKANDLPSSATFRRKVGHSLASYCRQNYPQFSCTRPKWTREMCVQAVDNFISQNGRLPHYKDCKSENGLPDPSTFFKTVGQTIYEYCGRPPRIRWTKEQCTQSLQQFVHQNGRLPQTIEYCSKNGLPGLLTFKEKVGENAAAYHIRKYPELCQRWTLTKICEALDSFVEQYGRPPLTPELSKRNMLPSYCTVQKVVGTTPAKFIRERYPEYYENPEQNQDMGWGMQMM